MVLHKVQKIIAEDTHRFRVLCLGRRTGKTFLSVVELIGQAIGNEDGLVSYVAPTYRQARDIAWQELKRETASYVVSINESRLEVVIPNKFGGTSTIDLRGWESIDSLRGQKRHFLVLDEVAMYRNFWVNWQEVLRPLLTDYKGGCLFASTPKGYNHFYDLYNLEQTNDNFKSFHYTSYDNPYIDSSEIDEAKRDMTVDRFQQEYMANFRKAEGLVYPEFNRDIHIVDEDKIPPLKETICGVDFGYTNPSAILVIGVDYDSNYWIVDEWYKTKQTKEQLITVLSGKSPNYVYPDPADAEGVAKLEEAGFNVMEVNKNKIEGINKVREMIKQGRLRVKRGCVNFVNEIESYHYPEDNANGNNKEEPVKENDHCFSWDTQISMADGTEKNIYEVKAGEFVKSKNGINEVLKAWVIKPEKLYETTFSNGYKVKSTIDHKFYTNRGIIPLNELRYDDTIIVLDQLKINQWKKQLFSMNKDIIGMVNTIAQQVGVKMVEKDYIKLFGKNTMEKYLKGYKYTTKTKTEEIIDSLILSLKQYQNICLNILKKGGAEKNIEKEVYKISEILTTLQKLGTLQKKVKSGIHNTEKMCGKTERNIKRYVKSVVKNMKHIILVDQNFVIRIVEQSFIGEEINFNITVESEHNYYANGILVKNCMDSLKYALYNHDINAYNPAMIQEIYQNRKTIDSFD